MKGKGCVVEVRDKTLVLITTSCDFVEIPKRDKGMAYPGMEIEYETRPERVPFPRKWMAVAAMVMVLIMGSLLMMPATSAMPVYVVSMDINPSLNILIDEAGHVVEVQPMNPEAERLSIRNIKGKTVEEAVSSLLDQLFEQGYFSERMEHYMVFSLAAIDSSIQETDVANMMVRLGNSIEEEKLAREIHLEVLSYTAREEELEEAESKDISLNYMLVRNQYQAMMTENSVETADEPVDESMEAMVRSILKKKNHPVTALQNATSRGVNPWEKAIFAAGPIQAHKNAAARMKKYPLNCSIVQPQKTGSLSPRLMPAGVIMVL